MRFVGFYRSVCFFPQCDYGREGKLALNCSSLFQPCVFFRGILCALTSFFALVFQGVGHAEVAAGLWVACALHTSGLK